MTGVAPASHLSPIYPQAAGETVIHAKGIVGITIEFPRDATWFEDNVKVAASTGTNIVYVYPKWQREDQPFCDFCFATVVEWLPEANFPPFVATCHDDAGNDVGCTFYEGPMEIYLVSDGEFTLTMMFPELTGRTEVEATGRVDGVLERIPMRCDPLPGPCDNLAFGGAVRTIGLDGRGAFARAKAYVDTPGSIPPNVSEIGAVSCAYPGFFAPDKSPDPSSHPYGCDVTNPWDASSNFWWPDPKLNGGGVVYSTGSSKTHGPQYLGFTVRKVHAVAGRMGAWGLWLEEGIVCPSGDYFDCNEPHH